MPSNPERKSFVRSYKERKTGFIIALFSAVCTFLFVHLWLHDGKFFNKIEDIGADIYMSILAHTGRSPKSIQEFLFIDIDEDSHNEWGPYLITPRDKLADLVKVAVEACPKLVVVDVNLSEECISANDQKLIEMLRRLRSHKCQNGAIHMLFHREITYADSDGKPRRPRERQSSLKGLEEIIDSTPHFHWATARFEPSPDLVIRRWRLWEPIPNNGSVVMIPSAQCLARAIVGDESCRHGYARENLTFPDCGCSADHATGASSHSVAEYRPGDRFLYTIPWKGTHQPSGQEGGGQDKEQLMTIPAWQIIQDGLNVDVEDRIVVIGGSYAAARDLYATPLGIMPGAMILINAMNAPMEHGSLGHPSQRLEIALIVGEWLVTAGVVFAINVPYITPAATFALLFIITYLMSVRKLQSGIWVDTTLVTISIFLHRPLETLFHFLHRNFHRRLRGASLLLSLTVTVSALTPSSARAAGRVAMACAVSFTEPVSECYRGHSRTPCAWPTSPPATRASS